MTSTTGPLAGVRIIESSMLGPAGITTALAELGADVIKVEDVRTGAARVWVKASSTSPCHRACSAISLCRSSKKPETDRRR